MLLQGLRIYSTITITIIIIIILNFIIIMMMIIKWSEWEVWKCEPG